MPSGSKTPMNEEPNGISVSDAVLLGVGTLGTLLLVSTMSVTAAAILGGGVLLFSIYQLIIRP